MNSKEYVNNIQSAADQILKTLEGKNSEFSSIDSLLIQVDSLLSQEIPLPTAKHIFSSQNSSTHSNISATSRDPVLNSNSPNSPTQIENTSTDIHSTKTQLPNEKFSFAASTHSTPQYLSSLYSKHYESQLSNSNSILNSSQPKEPQPPDKIPLTLPQIHMPLMTSNHQTSGYTSSVVPTPPNFAQTPYFGANNNTEYFDLKISSDDNSSSQIQLLRDFKVPSMETQYSITSLSWNGDRNHIAASYASKVSFTGTHSEFDRQNSGRVLIWSLDHKSTSPARKLTDESSVLTSKFWPFSPSLVIGGTHSGRISLWDIRIPQNTPSITTSISLNSHLSPVYCISQIGLSSAPSLLSISSDGRACIWSLKLLSEPLESFQLFPPNEGLQLDTTHIPHPQQDLALLDLYDSHITPMCCSVYSSLNQSTTGPISNNKNETGNSSLFNSFSSFFVGTAESAIYSFSRHLKGVASSALKAHCGPISCLDYNHDTGKLLSGSFDWTIRAWDIPSSREPTPQIYSLGNNYVTSVKWIPSTNSEKSFSATSEASEFSIFKYIDTQNKKTVDPRNTIAEEYISPTVSIKLSKSPLTCHSWNNTGNTVAIGSLDGSMKVFSFQE